MIKKIITILFSGFIALISYEIFLRYSPFEYGLSPVVYDNTIGMWNKKDFSDYQIKECYRTKYIFNRDGLPKNIFDYNKNKKDIIILGDSYIEALMVKNENIIHNSLSREYNNKYNFMNYGLSGSSPIQQFIILKEKVNLSNTKYLLQFINLEGDLLDVDSKNLGFLSCPKVYIDFKSFNDYVVIPPRVQSFYDITGDFMGNFQLYTYIKKTLYYFKSKIKEKKQVEKKQIESKDLSKNWLYLKSSIFQINKIALSKDITYKLVVVSNNELNKNILSNFLNQNNIPFLIKNNQNKFKLEGFSCDSHWNDNIHINITKYLKDINFLD